jgi:hypothetical protein
MSNVAVVESEKYVSVCFYIEHDKPLAIGEKMNEINEDAYMNGYNWEALFAYYLPKKAPDLLEGLGSDPEAGMYVAYYDNVPESKPKAERLAKLIEGLLDNEEELYRIVREEGDQIQWD